MMLIAKNDEEKRSKAWRFVTTVTTILIILITAFFMIKLFAGNPLKGLWKAEDTDMTLLVETGGNAEVKWDDMFQGSDVQVKMTYTLDKSAKTIQFRLDESSLKDAVKHSKGAFTEENLRASLETVTTSFDYSLEQNELILTEREYGEQFVFIKN